MLSKLVAFPTVPQDDHREDCRQASIYLKNTLKQLGADSTLVQGVEGKNPLVLATFRAQQTAEKRKRVLFYGTSLSQALTFLLCPLFFIMLARREINSSSFRLQGTTTSSLPSPRTGRARPGSSPRATATCTAAASPTTRVRSWPWRRLRLLCLRGASLGWIWLC